MSNYYGARPDLTPRAAVLSFNLAQAAATYNVGTVSGGNILIKSVTPFVSVAAAGLVSAALGTDNTTADVIIAATVLASLTGGKNLTPMTVPLYLASGKHITGTIVGTGSGGTMLVLVEYYPLTDGAVIA